MIRFILIPDNWSSYLETPHPDAGLFRKLLIYKNYISEKLYIFATLLCPLSGLI